ncbi:hypothetical protein FPT12_18160 [Pseudomonas sp. H3(2019)]|nr:hypothetical protein FPT12_18160 [Pseudomonas sp. H3(2019)]
MGASLLAIAVQQSPSMVNVMASSRASSLPQWIAFQMNGFDSRSFVSPHQSSLTVMFGIAGVAASCKTIRAPT